MNLMAGVVASFLLLGGQSPQAGVVSALARARSLYASAAYEEALNRLNAIDSSADPVEVAELRALCWLGLGNDAEAERELESLVWRVPGHVMRDADVSPRLAELYGQVRQRLLPAVASDLLSNARSLYEAGQYAAASEHLDELLSLTTAAANEANPDAAGVVGLADLRVVAEGLKELAEAEISKPARAAEPVVFSSSDRDVVSPVEISRAMPHWTPPRGSVPPGLYQGLLEVVINEQGRVESPVMRRPVHPSYDAILLAATADWRFQPAIKDGEAVRYRKFFEVILHTRKVGRQE